MVSANLFLHPASVNVQAIPTSGSESFVLVFLSASHLMTKPNPTAVPRSALNDLAEFCVSLFEFRRYAGTPPVKRCANDALL
jgi:hypothetical protein